MRIIMIDDEPISLKVLESELSAFEDVEIVGQYTKPAAAYEEINETNPDVAFVDIEMGAISGLEVGQLLISKFDNIEIVFVTAYSQYAIDAFEMNAIDYILKPANEKRLSKTIERLRRRINDRRIALKEGDKEVLRIACFGGFQVFTHEGEPIRWRTKKAKEVFAYLWVNSNNIVHRDMIIDEIYYHKTVDQATTYLHTTIYQLRSTLKDLGYMDSIRYFNEGYRLNIPYKSDLDELDYLLSFEIVREKQAEKILEIYKDDLISEGYSWIIESQQIYRNKVFQRLGVFVSSQIELGIFTGTLEKCLAKLYQIEPYSEELACLFIKFYGEQGQKFDLNDFYKSYSVNLMEEMNMASPKAVKRLYAEYMNRLQ